MKKGKLVISLDFELLWGIFDVVDYNSSKQYFWETREVVPEILKLFREYKIHATWATVGMLLNENWKEWEENIPSQIPHYKNKSLSAYEFGKTIKSKTTEEFCFAPDLVKMVSGTAGQEVATHTYSHYYCLEQGQTAKSFDKDMATAVLMAKKIEIDLESLVFPRNQIRLEYLSICTDHGIKNVRSNPSSWYWKDIASDSLLTKVARTGDAYVNLGKKSYPISEILRKPDLPLEQKASRFLRPVEGNKLLRRSKIYRIKKEMALAAKSNKIYHLWWHPHNFGNQPLESLKDLKELLIYFKQMQDKYAFQSLNMQEVGALYS